MGCTARAVLAVAAEIVVRTLAAWAVERASAPRDLKLRAARTVAAAVVLAVEVALRRSPSAECTWAAEMPLVLAA